MPKVEKGKRIAYNTFALYFRMIITMLVTLYTSRIVLNVLGVDDFGIYNIVGGVVVVFSFLNNAMIQATQRFLNVEIGKIEGDVNKVFSQSLMLHIVIALIVLLLGETIGFWFLNSQINIPHLRTGAANIVYQFSLLTLCIGFIQVPYNASIIAYEKMTFYAYISILEVILKLLVVFSISYTNYDRLVIYAFVIMITTFVIFLIYKIYCNKKFGTCRFYVVKDYLSYKDFIRFSGWSFFGSIANVSANQGVNVLLNMFFGVTVNAAMGITNQVNAALNSFVSNFQTAFKPQIVKTYIEGNKRDLIELNLKTAKYSYYLLYILAVPVFFEINFILKLWLGIIPEYCASFCRLILIFSLIDSLSAPFWMTIQATGRIRNYQIVISVILILNLFFSYATLYLGYSPISVFAVKIALGLLSLFVRIYFLMSEIKLSLKMFFNSLILPILKVTLISLVPIIICFLVLSVSNRIFFIFAFSFVWTICAIWFCGVDRSERIFIKKMILKFNKQ